MATLTLRKHAGGIDRSVAPFELADGQFVTLANLWPSEEALGVRPGQTAYLDVLDPTKGGRGLALIYSVEAAAGGGTTPGPHSAATITNDSAVGSIPWINPERAGASDNQWATATATAGEVTEESVYLRLTGFGFALPTNAAVTGIKVGLERHRTWLGGVPLVRDAKLRLIKGGVVQSHDKADTATDWPPPPGGVGGDETREYGGPTDLWNTTWTAAEINAPGFGVALSVALRVGGDGFATARVDHVHVTVYYTLQENPAEPFRGKEFLYHVGTILYTDRAGAWAPIAGANALAEAGNLEVVTWLGKAYIQDGLTGPWVYDPSAGTFGPWAPSGDNPPPIARYMILDGDRLYAAYAAGEPTAVRASHLDDPDTWEMVARPGGAEGTVLFVGKQDGDYITGLKKWGTWKMIWKRRSTWRLTGDNGDTWQLEQVLPVGCVSHRTIVDCGNVLVWATGLRVVSLGQAGFDINFGKPVEALLRATPLIEWDKACAVFWDGLLMLWYRHDALVVHDFRHGTWFGPWEGVPANAAVVDRDDNTLWLAHSQRAAVAQFAGDDDFGVPIVWEAETKHYDFDAPAFSKLAHTLSVVADSGVGPLSAALVTDERRRSALTYAFAGTGIRRLTKRLAAQQAGATLGMALTGTGRGGKVYELSLRAERLRRV